MLIRTGSGSISLVAGCCWVHSVLQPPPAGQPDQNAVRVNTVDLSAEAQFRKPLRAAADPADNQPLAR
ncbi:MAG: hypothetical protein RLZZ611_748 [Cyanobacteriota bacterium]|jgi:hypothetical protein